MVRRRLVLDLLQSEDRLAMTRNHAVQFVAVVEPSYLLLPLVSLPCHPGTREPYQMDLLKVWQTTILFPAPPGSIRRLVMGADPPPGGLHLR